MPDPVTVRDGSAERLSRMVQLPTVSPISPTVWLVCGLTAALAAVMLAFVPKLAFSDAPVVEAAAVR